MKYNRSIFFEIYRRGLVAATLHIIMLFILIAGCAAPSDKHIMVNYADAKDDEQEIHCVAKVTRVSLEGGFYGLVAEDGRRFLPLNLPDDFRKDGQKTRVRGMIKKDVATIYMWGTPLEIIEIEILD